MVYRRGFGGIREAADGQSQAWPTGHDTGRRHPDTHDSKAQRVHARAARGNAPELAADLDGWGICTTIHHDAVMSKKPVRLDGRGVPPRAFLQLLRDICDKYGIR